MNTFSGGVIVEEHKELTEHSAIEEIPLPPEIVIYMQMHLGAPCKPLVAKGDKVKIGQKVGSSESFVSAPVHASVSGSVSAVEPRPHPMGVDVMAVVIKPDAEQNEFELMTDRGKEPSAQEIREAALEAGLVGLGGAGFPTHVKIADIPEKPIEVVIVNGCECEPYLTADSRVMLEYGHEVLDGLKLLMKATEAKRGVIGIEENKPECIKKLRSLTSEEAEIEIIELASKYPQGSEKQLINVVTGREVPSGLLPRDVGALVQNVLTTVSLSRAIRKRQPVIERIATVTGLVNEPKNIRVKVGTPLKYMIEAAGGLQADARRVVMGGPMMGSAQANLESAAIKTTSGLLALPALPDIEAASCIRCARCVEACPINLLPLRFAAQAAHEAWDMMPSFGVLDCIECGSCSFACPAKIPIVHYIRVGKATLRKKADSAKKTASN